MQSYTLLYPWKSMGLEARNCLGLHCKSGWGVAWATAASRAPTRLTNWSSLWALIPPLPMPRYDELLELSEVKHWPVFICIWSSYIYWEKELGGPSPLLRPALCPPNYRDEVHRDQIGLFQWEHLTGKMPYPLWCRPYCPLDARPKHFYVSQLSPEGFPLFHLFLKYVSSFRAVLQISFVTAECCFMLF